MTTRREQDDVQPEGAVLLIGEPRVRAVGMQALEQAVDEVPPVGTPFVEALIQEAQLRQAGTAVFARGQGACARIERAGYVVEQAFVKGAKLPVGRGPFAAAVRGARLVEVTLRSRKAELPQ